MCRGRSYTDDVPISNCNALSPSILLVLAQGGKRNSRTTEDVVSLMTLNGEEYLHYKVGIEGSRGVKCCWYVLSYWPWGSSPHEGRRWVAWGPCASHLSTRSASPVPWPVTNKTHVAPPSRRGASTSPCCVAPPPTWRATCPSSARCCTWTSCTRPWRRATAAAW